MTKADIIGEISKSTGVKAADVAVVTDSFMEVVKDTLRNKENVYLRGFGTFEYRYRIRKLTPRECFRLMGVDDADINRIDAHRVKTVLKSGKVKEKPIPKSAKYKLAGNSIVVDVLYHIFYQMFIAEPPKPKPTQLSLFD